MESAFYAKSFISMVHSSNCKSTGNTLHSMLPHLLRIPNRHLSPKERKLSAPFKLRRRGEQTHGRNLENTAPVISKFPSLQLRLNSLGLKSGNSDGINP